MRQEIELDKLQTFQTHEAATGALSEYIDHSTNQKTQNESCYESMLKAEESLENAAKTAGSDGGTAIKSMENTDANI